ncbi:Hint domain-containing protein [Lentibacter algarum]|uniref:Hint domain-containing protein n=1 Tax=Lentibacter algarum TaxID=576131 RepID=UPI001C09724A|nr:Hint domain-containing protein [Lentibacter algarum]MBU2982601.1 Hint domain-containing protein [Lentibacter algarum]
MPSVNTGLGGPTGHGENNFLSSSLTTGNYDDGSILVDITSVFGAGGIDFFGTSYTSLYINSNGLITFTGPNTTYNGTDLASLNQPAIAPFWTDVNITGGNASGTNNIYWDLDPANGTFTVTWYEVEPYSGSGTDTFQMVLSDLGGGTWGVEFIYEDIGFTNGYGAQAQVGVTDGGSNDYIVPGSGNATALSNYDTADLDSDSPDGTWDMFMNNGTVVCFVQGTLIETDTGYRPVEWLREGDMIRTADNGFQPLKAALNSRFVAGERTQPVCIKAGCLANTRDLSVSPNHRILINDSLCEILFGEREVFVLAKHLLGLPGIDTSELPYAQVSYYHLLLDQHEVIFANEQPTESFFTGEMAELTLGNTAPRMQSAIALLEPEQETARMTLKSYEAHILIEAMRSATQEHAA